MIKPIQNEKGLFMRVYSDRTGRFSNSNYGPLWPERFALAIRRTECGNFQPEIDSGLASVLSDPENAGKFWIHGDQIVVHQPKGPKLTGYATQEAIEALEKAGYEPKPLDVPYTFIGGNKILDFVAPIPNPTGRKILSETQRHDSLLYRLGELVSI